MTKACKELIEKAKHYNGEELTSIYIINSGRLYSGFWGKNGFNKIIVIGCRSTEDGKEYYNVSNDYEVDVVRIQELAEHDQCNIDISNKLGCIHIWFNKTMKLNTLLSDLVMEIVK